MGFILRHFEASSLDRIEAGWKPPRFDAYVLHQSEQDWSRANRLTIAGLLPTMRYRYHNILMWPRPEWAGNPWFDALVAIAQKLVAQDGRIAIPWEPGAPAMIDWRKMDTVRTKAVVNKIIKLSPASGVFLDQVWTHPRPWMFAPEGPQYDDFPAIRWAYWQKRLLQFLSMLRARMGSPAMGGVTTSSSYPVLANCAEMDVPPPLYLEHAEWRWAATTAFWSTVPGTVLSVYATSHRVNDAIMEWAGTNRWLAFTGHDLDAIDAAYAAAAAEEE